MSTVSQIAVTKFGGIRVRRVLASGRIEFELNLDPTNGSAMDLVKRAMNAVPRTKKKSLGNDVLVLEFDVSAVDKSRRVKHLKSIAEDFLLGIEQAAGSPELQTLFNRQPAYVNDSRRGAR